MATIKSTKLDTTTDGSKKLAKVIFTPQVPNPANQHDVEVVFQVKRVDSPLLDGTPYAVIGPLSSTRMDTREPYVLSEEQQDAVIEAALIEASENDGFGWPD